jgi:hypothetical protein
MYPGSKHREYEYQGTYKKWRKGPCGGKMARRNTQGIAAGKTGKG